VSLELAAALPEAAHDIRFLLMVLFDAHKTAAHRAAAGRLCATD